MLCEARLDKRFWGEAVITAIYLKNRSPTAALSGGIPEQVWTGSKVSLSHLRVFGCKAFSLIPEHNRQKFDSKAKECIFVGYCETSKGYRLVDLTEPKKIIKSRSVHFIELTDNSIYKSSIIKCDNKSNMTESDIKSNKICDINTNNYNMTKSKMIVSNNENNFNNNDKVCVPILNCDNNRYSEFISSSAIPDGNTENGCVGSEAPSATSSTDADGEAAPFQFVDCDQVEEYEQSSAEEGNSMVESASDVSTYEQAQEVPSQRPVRSTRGIPPKRKASMG